MLTLRLAAFIFANIGICVGYAVIGIALLPRTAEFVRRLIPFVTVHLRATTISGTVFFLSCGATHLEMALHVALTPSETVGHVDSELHMLVIHLVQVVAVWGLIIGTYLEFVRPVMRALVSEHR